MSTNETPQEAAMHAQPQKEHRWLEKLLGEWVIEAEAAEPGKAPEKGTGVETVRSLGGLWVVAEGRHQMQGQDGLSIMTLGYDPAKGRYIGTWIGSMMTNLWVYDGALDAAGRVLTLDTEGPAMDGQGTARYQDIIEFIADDHRMLRSQVLAPDGQWQQFMEARYRRKV